MIPKDSVNPNPGYDGDLFIKAAPRTARSALILIVYIMETVRAWAVRGATLIITAIHEYDDIRDFIIHK